VKLSRVNSGYPTLVLGYRRRQPQLNSSRSCLSVKAALNKVYFRNFL